MSLNPDTPAEYASCNRLGHAEPKLVIVEVSPRSPRARTARCRPRACSGGSNGGGAVFPFANPTQSWFDLVLSASVNISAPKPACSARRSHRMFDAIDTERYRTAAPSNDLLSVTSCASRDMRTRIPGLKQYQDRNPNGYFQNLDWPARQRA